MMAISMQIAWQFLLPEQIDILFKAYGKMHHCVAWFSSEQLYI